MAKYYTLSVYNAARRLYEALKTNTQKMSRDERFAFVIPLMGKVEDIMATISFANDAEVKSTVLEPAIAEIRRMQVRFRNLQELHLITEKGFAVLSERSEAVRRQLCGWSKKYGEGTGNKPESV